MLLGRDGGGPSSLSLQAVAVGGRLAVAACGSVGCSCWRQRSQHNAASYLAPVQGTCVSKTKTIGGGRERSASERDTLQLAV